MPQCQIFLKKIYDALRSAKESLWRRLRYASAALSAVLIQHPTTVIRLPPAFTAFI
jgi:hypothetical protein